MLLWVAARFLYTAIYFFVVSVACVVALAVAIYKYIESKRRVVHISGTAEKQFDAVLKAFRQNFRTGWEREGASFAVYYKGKLVVDIWGGFADRESGRLWRENTMNVAFSTSKAVGATCVALLVDRGLLKYDEKIASFWPKFGRHGKEDITVQMVLSHTAGLAVVDRQITQEDAMDADRMAEIFEDQAPNWEPGSLVGYHAFSYGWLVDQIVRRVDPKKRSIGQFFKEELAIPHELDFHLGLPQSEAYRVSRLQRPSVIDRISEFITDPNNVDYGYMFKSFLTNGMMVKVGSNPSWLQSVFRMPLNNPELYPMEQCAVFGIGTSRALAKLFELLRQGKIISEEMVDFVHVPVVREDQRDLITGAHVSRGHGFTHTYHTDKNNRTFLLLGHAGFGGQNVRIDRENELTFAYMSNGLKGGLGDRARTYVKLLDAVYKCLPNAIEEERPLPRKKSPITKFLVSCSRSFLSVFGASRTPSASHNDPCTNDPIS